MVGLFVHGESGEGKRRSGVAGFFLLRVR